jgi:hypothetical protein
VIGQRRGLTWDRMANVAHIKRGLVHGQGDSVVAFGRQDGHRVVRKMLGVEEPDVPCTPSCALMRERVSRLGRYWVAHPEIVPKNLRCKICVELRLLAL